jgi:hypothetical protein
MYCVPASMAIAWSGTPATTGHGAPRAITPVPARRSVVLIWLSSGLFGTATREMNSPPSGGPSKNRFDTR